MLTLSRWKIIAVTLSVIFGILFSLPNVLPQKTLDAMPGWLPHQKLNLGLDLQGGSYLLYEVDTDALHRERLSDLMEDTRTQLRSEQIPFGELAQQGEVISVRIGDPSRYEAALNLLRKNLGAPLAGVIGGKDVAVAGKGDNRIEVTFVPEAQRADAAKAVDQSIETIRRRIDSLGTKEPSINRQGDNRIMIQAAGESDPERLRAVIGKTAKLTFQMVDETVTPEDVQAGRLPAGSELLQSEDRYAPYYVVKKRAIVSGDELTNASQTFDQNGRPAVGFAFN